MLSEYILIGLEYSLLYRLNLHELEIDDQHCWWTGYHVVVVYNHISSLLRPALL